MALNANREFALSLLRAYGGAVLFAFPMLMTMEMWALGFYVAPVRLALLIVLAVPLLIGLSYYAGIHPDAGPLEDVLDALTAYAVGFAAAITLLLLFAVIGPGMSVGEIIGKVALQAVPASIGAMLARSHISEDPQREARKQRAGYASGIFLMAAGAIFLSSSLASTEEMVLISYQMTPIHTLGLMLFSLAVGHGFVRAAVVQGSSEIPSPAMPFWSVFARFTVVAYAVALLISVFMLWTFERSSGMALAPLIQATVVLGFPAALGAGAARLIL